ncbi:MAG: tol-pal system protein YbgF [Gammaproteobacteria bacterium]|nr:MAG: tol-pal system protein YbgF [Gammaproteobacteria bacterium]
MRFLPTISSLMASFVLAILVSAPAVAQQDRQPMVDLVIQIQQLQDEVRTLTGRIEDQGLELENLRDRQRDQYLDLDQRIGELRSSSPEARISGSANTKRAGATTSGTKYTSQSTAPPRGDIPDVRPPLDTPSSVTALANPDTQAREMVTSPAAEKEAYERAFQSLKDRKYADSATQFQSFLQQYPSSDYADNAQYWLGESYYVTRNYDIALAAFQGLLSGYPDSPKVADALLKIGFSHYELKQWDQARAALEQVQQQYPGTTLARLAGSRLRSLKLEGHY